MAKLTGAKKKAFLERMAKGRKKAARGGPKHSHRPKPKANPKRKPPAKKKAVANKRKPAAKKNGRLTGQKKLEFLKRMARGRKAAKNGTRANGRKRPTTKKAGNGKRGRRQNSSDAEASALFETFHGKPPGRIIDYEQAYKYPSHYAELGKLIELRFYLDDANRDFPLTGFKDCQAVSTPDGQNIYLLGGDQTIDFEALGVSSDKDFIELGPCTYICYFTVKGFHDFEPTKYWHRFGEEDEVFPRLTYDRLNQTLFLVGGNYQVKREGIVN